MDRRTRREVLATTGAALAVGAGVAGCSRLSESGTVAADAEFAAATFRRGLRRHGYVSGESVPDAAADDWRVPDLNTGDHTASKSSPVAAPDGNVVVGGDAGIVQSVTPDGTVNWTAEVDRTSRGIHATPTVVDGSAGGEGSSDSSDGGTVFVGAYDGALYAFDLATGDRIWRRPLGGSIGGSTAYHDGTLYVAVEYPAPSGALFGVDAATGEVTFEDDRVTDHPHSTPGIDRDAGTLSIGANDGTLYTWSYPDVEFQWTFDAGAPVKAPIATYDGAAFFGSWDSAVFRVDLATGSQDWRFDAGNYVMSGVGIDPGRGVVYAGDHGGDVFALDAATGERRWRFPTGGRVTGCPTVTGDHVVVGSYDGHLYALDADDGSEVWRVGGDIGHVTCEPLVYDGAVYYTARATDERSGGLRKAVER